MRPIMRKFHFLKAGTIVVDLLLRSQGLHAEDKPDESFLMTAGLQSADVFLIGRPCLPE